MTTRRQPLLVVLAAALAATLALSACGDDDGDDEASSDTTAETSAESTTESTEAADDTEGGAEDAAEGAGEEAAVTEAVTAVFDSSVPFDDKVAFIQDGEAHRADHDGYVAAADAVGGIAVEPTDVAVEGDTATVTYRVLFGGNEAYADLTMDVSRQGDAWVVPAEAFCGFLASARTPCANPPAGTEAETPGA